MANGGSRVEEAQEKMTSVSAQFEEAQETVLEWIEHFEAEKERLSGQMGGSHGDDVPAVLAEIDRILEALHKAAEILPELAKKATEIEARL